MTEKELTVFFSTFVFLQFWNMFNARIFGRDTCALCGIFENKAFLFIALGIAAVQVLVVQVGGKFFRTVPLSLQDWLFIIGGTSIVLIIGEVVRSFARKRNAELAPATLAEEQGSEGA